MKKFVDLGAESDATETELPAPSEQLTHPKKKLALMEFDKHKLYLLQLLKGQRAPQVDEGLYLPKATELFRLFVR